MRLWLLTLGSCIALAACGVDESPKELGEPCTRDSECMEPFQCLAGVCSDEEVSE